MHTVRQHYLLFLQNYIDSNLAINEEQYHLTEYHCSIFMYQTTLLPSNMPNGMAGDQKDIQSPALEDKTGHLLCPTETQIRGCLTLCL